MVLALLSASTCQQIANHQHLSVCTHSGCPADNNELEEEEGKLGTAVEMEGNESELVTRDKW